MKYTPVGVDIAKHLIQVHFIDEGIGEVIDKQLRSRDFLEYFRNLLLENYQDRRLKNTGREMLKYYYRGVMTISVNLFRHSFIPLWMQKKGER